MLLKFRLYKKYDYDLLYLAVSRSVSPGRAIKKCLSSYIKGETFREEISIREKISDEEIPKMKEYQIELDEECIEFLSKVHYRKANEFLKMLLRSCYSYNLTEIYMNDGIPVKQTVTKAPVSIAKETKTEPVKKQEPVRSPQKEPEPVKEPEETGNSGFDMMSALSSMMINY